MIEEKIKLKDKTELTLIRSEFEGLSKPRFKVNFQGDNLIVSAKDDVALKSVLNSINQAREIYAKISKI